MSIKVMQWVWDHAEAKGIKRLVLLAIADNADDSGANAWPSNATLQQKAGIDARTVQRSIKELIASGELEVEYNAGRGGVNVYRVITTPRDISTPGNLPPRQAAAPGRTPPRQSAPPAESRQTPGTAPGTPRQPAGRTVLEPSLNRQSSSAAAARQPTTEWFDKFWEVYPRKAGKGAARAKFAAALKRASFDEILAGAVRYRDDPNRDEGFTAHPSTWLQQDRWADDPLPPRASGRPQAAAYASSVAVPERKPW